MIIKIKDANNNSLMSNRSVQKELLVKHLHPLICIHCTRRLWLSYFNGPTKSELLANFCGASVLEIAVTFFFTGNVHICPLSSINAVR